MSNFRMCPHCGSERPNTETMCGFCGKHLSAPPSMVFSKEPEGERVSYAREVGRASGPIAPVQILGIVIALWGWIMMGHAWHSWNISARERVDGKEVVSYEAMNDRQVYVTFGAGLFIGGLVLYSGARRTP